MMRVFVQASATSCFNAVYGTTFSLSTTDNGGFVHLNGKCNCTTDTTDLDYDMMLLCSHIYSSEGIAVI
jgi:hypothetical protein